jgi:thioredoxin 1
MTIAEVGNTNFWTKVVKTEGPALVAFWARWCGACKATMPAIEQLSIDHGHTLPVYSVNVGDEPAIAYEYGVTAAPTLKVFHHGQVVKTITGAKTKAQLEAELADYLTA